MAKKVKLSAKSSVKKDGKVINADSLLKKIREVEKSVSIPITIDAKSVDADSTKVVYEIIEKEIKKVDEEVDKQTEE